MSGMQKSFPLEEAKRKLPSKQADYTVAELEEEGIAPTSWTVKQLDTKLESLKAYGAPAADIAEFEKYKETRTVEDSGKKPTTKIKGGQSGYTAVTLGDASGATIAFTEKEIHRRLESIRDKIAELNAALGNGSVISALKEVRAKEDEGQSDFYLDSATIKNSFTKEELEEKHDELEKTLNSAKSKVDRLRKEGKTKEANILQLDVNEDQETLDNIIALHKALVSKPADDDAARAASEKDLEKAKRRHESAQARQMGLQGGQKQISTKGLDQTESLVYKEQPKPGDEYALTFNGMIQTATSKGIKNKKFNLFQSSIVATGGVMKQIALEVLPGHKHIPVLKTLLTKMAQSDHEIEKNSDLVKLCWLYLGGEKALAAAKNSPEFLKALRVLESRNFNTVTNPIDDIQTVDQIPDRKNVKDLFSAIRETLASDTKAQAEITANSLAIIDACSELVLNPTTAKEFNVIDTLFYAIMNFAGAKGDISRFEKIPGPVKNTGNILVPSARKLITKEQEAAEQSTLGGYVNPSRGHKSEPTRTPGNKAFNTGVTEPKANKDAVAPVVRNPSDIDAAVREEVQKACEFGGVDFESGALGDTAQRLQSMISSGRATGSTIASVLAAHFKAFSERSYDVRDPKTGAVTKKVLIGPKGVLQSQLEFLKSLEARTLSLTDAQYTQRKQECLTQISNLKKVIEKSDQILAQLVEDTKKLKPTDLAAMGDVFKAAKPIATSNALASTSVVPLDSPEGKVLTSYLNAVVEVIENLPKVEAPASATVKEDDADLKAAKEALASIRQEIGEALDLKSEAVAEKNKTLVAKWNKKLSALRKQEEDAINKCDDEQRALDLELLTRRKKGHTEFADQKDSLERDKLIAQGAIVKDKAAQILSSSASEGKIDILRVETLFNDIVPEGINNKVSDRILNNTEDTFKTLREFDAEAETQTTGWQRPLRTALRDLASYLDTPELLNKDAEGRYNAVSKLIEPFRESLKKEVDFDWFVENEGLSTEAKIARRNKAIEGSVESEEDILQTDLASVAKDDKSLDDAEEVIKRGLLFTRLHDNQVIGILGVSPDSPDGQRLTRNMTSRAYEEIPFGPTEEPVLDENDEPVLDEEGKPKTQLVDIRKHLKTEDVKFRHSSRKTDTTAQITMNTRVIKPGTALLGNPEVVRTEALARDLYYDNTQNLDLHVERFYQACTEFVRRFHMADANSSFEEDPNFVSGLINLIGRYKKDLSTSPAAARLETSIFLPGILKGDFEGSSVSLNKTQGLDVEFSNMKTHLPSETILSKLSGAPEVAGILEYLEFQKNQKLLTLPVKIMKAPVIGLGENTLTLNSATLLNIMSCIRSFTSPEAFDLSLNKKNEDVLSGLLNTNNYSKKFKISAATALFMKLYFLINLKKAIAKVNVLEQFKGDFLNISMEDRDDPTLKKMKEKLKELNKNFESIVLADFTKDFKDNGTIDKAISAGLKNLRELADKVDGGIDVWKQGRELDHVLLPKGEEELKEFVSTLGRSKDEAISSGMRNEWNTDSLSPAARAMSQLLFGKDDQPLLTALNNAITIVKTGLKYDCSFKITEAIAKYDAYDTELKHFDQNGFNEAMTAFTGNTDVMAFANNFKTEELTNDLKVSVVSDEGFNNLENDFLASFVKHFSYDALMSSIASKDLDEYVETFNKSFDSSNQNEELKKYKVAFVGLYQKGAGDDLPTADELTRSLEHSNKGIQALEKELKNPTETTNVEELTAQIEAAKKRNKEIADELNSIVVDPNSVAGKEYLDNLRAGVSAKTRELDKFGTVPQDQVVSKKVDANGNIGIELSRPKQAGYKLVTKESAQGFREGVKGGETSGGRRARYTILSASDVIQRFATGVDRVIPILIDTYGEGAGRNKEGKSIPVRLREYRNSVEASLNGVKGAIKTIEGDALAPQIQEIALGYLTSIPAQERPTGIPILENPELTIQYAKKYFDPQNGVLNGIGAFAQYIASGIIKGKTNTDKAIEAVNKVLSNTTFLQQIKDKKTPYQVQDLTWDGGVQVATKGVSKVTAAALAPTTERFFAANMTEDATRKRLEAAKNRVVVKGATAFPDVKKINDSLQESLKPLQEKAKELTANIAATKAEINTAIAAPKDLSKKTKPAEVNIDTLKLRLNSQQTSLASVNKQIENLNASANAQLTMEPQMMTYLNNIYKEAESLLTNYEKTIASTEGNKNKATRFQTEIAPLQKQLPAVISFISAESDAANKTYKPAKDLLQNFIALLKQRVNFVDTYAESTSIGVLAAVNFIALLEAAAEPEEVELKNAVEAQAQIKALTDQKEELEKSANKKTDTEEVVKARKLQISAIDTKIRNLRGAKKEIEESWSSLDQNPYVISMAYKIWSTKKLLDANNYTILGPEPGKPGVLTQLPAIRRAVQSAVFILLKDDSDFVDMVAGFNSSFHLGFSVDPSESESVASNVKRVQVYAQISDFWSIKKVAEHDIPYTKTLFNSAKAKAKAK